MSGLTASDSILEWFSEAIAPAFELLMAEHYEVLVEQLLPNADAAYQAAVAEVVDRSIGPQRIEAMERKSRRRFGRRFR